MNVAEELADKMPNYVGHIAVLCVRDLLETLPVIGKQPDPSTLVQFFTHTANLAGSRGFLDIA